MKSIFLVWVFVPAIFFMLSEAVAQQNGSITGSVMDFKGAPVPGATVQIEGREGGVVADLEGNYVFAELTPGSYRLLFRSLGYKGLEKEVMLTSGENLKVDVQLEESSLGLGEVVVSGTLRPTYVTQSPVKVEVITARYLNTFSPAAASSIVEGIKLVNGVQEVVACGVCFTNSISINGLPGPYTAVLMDGTPMYGSLASVYGLNGIPSMLIDRFEVIKGPGSTLYGSEAVAGVINIITKDPEKQPPVSVDVMGTSHLESFGNLAVAPKLGKFNGFIGLNWAYMGDFDDRNKDGFGDMINLDRYSLFTKWNIARRSGKKFTVAGRYFYEDRRNGVEEYLENRNYRHLRGSGQVYGESVYTSRAELFGTYQLPLQENIRLDYSLSRHLQDSYYGADEYKAEQQILFANFIWDKQLGPHALLGGFTSRYQFYDDNTVATAKEGTGLETNDPEKQLIPGIFLQDEWRVKDWLTLLGGARLDHYSAHGLIFSPRLNLKVEPGEWTTLRGNFGTGFRVVNLFAEDHAFVTGQRSVEIVEELKPERSYNASLNLNHVFTLGNSQGTLDLEGYYTYFTNKIIPDYSSPQKIIYANTEGYALSRGIGMNLMQEFSFPLGYSVGLNWQRVQQVEQNGAGELERSQVEFAPEWSGLATLNYRWRRAGLTLAYSMNMTGPMALPLVYDLDQEGNPLSYGRPVRSQSYSIHNLQLTKEFSASWTLYGGLQNIFDYIQPVSPLVGYNDPNASTGFSEYFDTAYSFSPIHGREFYLGIRWEMGREGRE